MKNNFTRLSYFHKPCIFFVEDSTDAAEQVKDTLFESPARKERELKTVYNIAFFPWSESTNFVHYEARLMTNI